MSKIPLILSLSFFSILLLITSFIKNETRTLEKKIYEIDKKIVTKKRDLNETQLDFFYLSSPNYLSKKIENLDFIKYKPIDFSRIYLNLENFLKSQNSHSNLKIKDEKEIQKK